MLLQEVNPVAVSLQETMLQEFTPCPSEYIYIRTQYDPAVGAIHGSLLYIRKDIPHARLMLNTPLEAVAVQLHLDKQITLCSLYLPPNQPVSQEDIVNLINQLPDPFIIAGDLNARHPLWGDITANPKGKLLAATIESENLAFLNTGEPTHYHIQTGALSCIDLALCNPNCLLDFTWWVCEDLHGSDHFPSIIKSNTSPPDPRPSKWCIEKADWSHFHELSSITITAEEVSSVEEGVQLATDTLHSAGLQSIPKTAGVFRRRPVPWWSNVIGQLHRDTRRALTRLRRHRSEINLVSYRKCRSLLRRTMREARRQSWSSFVSSINSKTNPTLVWKKLRKISGKFTPCPPPVLKTNGHLITDAKEVSNIFAEHFANISRKNPNSPGAVYRERIEHQPLDFTAFREEVYNVPFTVAEFDDALASCNDTAPGPDDILYAMLRHIPAITKLFLVGLFNRIWKESIFPLAWILAIVLPFCKPLKDGYIPSSYRPIALTSCLCKLMEKMVNTRLVWFLEYNKIYSPIQCGSRKFRSTLDILLQLESSICKAFVYKHHHISVFFDLEKAYDTTWRHGILKAVHACGIRGEMALFMKSFISSHLFQVRVGSTLSDVMSQEEGVPQGSVLSVSLFALAINGIASVIPPGVLSALFVDDLSISFHAAKLAMAERKLQLCINRIVEWADKNGFKFSSSKSVVVHFCRIRNLHPDPDLYLKGQRLPCVDEARFLGMHFDRRLTWVPHLQATKVNCLKSMQVLRVLSHMSWGSDRATMLRLHQSLILSKLSYGCEFYSSATSNTLKIIDSIHHSSIRLATGAFRSSPIPSLLVDAGEMPLDLHRQSALTSYWIRLQRTPDTLASKTAKVDFNSNLYDSHPSLPWPFGYRVKRFLADLHIPIIQVLPFQRSAVPPWKLPFVTFCRYFSSLKKNFSDVELRNTFLSHAEIHENSNFIFTDGSKSDAGVGFGVHLDNFNQKGALPVIASTYTAELHGILKALEVVASHSESNFTIFCDSRSVLESLENFNSSHPLILKILEWLFLLKRRGREVSFCWVPAHVGVHGNEEADRLAKEAAILPVPVRCRLPHTDIIHAVKREIHSIWQFRWDLVGPNKMKEICHSIRPWKYTSLPRRQEVILCRLRLGHTRLTHGFLMCGDLQPHCEDCIVPLTVRHFLIECPSLVALRRRYFSHCLDSEGGYSLAKVLGEGCNILALFNFLQDAGILKSI